MSSMMVPGTISEVVGLFQEIISGDLEGSDELHTLIYDWKDAQLFSQRMKCVFEFYDSPETYIHDDCEAFTLTVLFPLAMSNYKSAV